MFTLLFSLQSNAEIFDTEKCTELDWSYRWFDIGELHDGSAWDNAHLDNIDMISLRGVRQGGRKGKAIFYTSHVGDVFLEVDYTGNVIYKSDFSMSSITCGGRHKLNYDKYVKQKADKIRTSYRNMRATLTSQYWDEYAPIAHNVYQINKATNGQKIGVQLSIKNTHVKMKSSFKRQRVISCSIKAYTAENKDLKDLRKDYLYSSNNIRNYVVEKELTNSDCIIYSEDVQSIIQQLKDLIYKGPSNYEDKSKKDMPVINSGPTALDKHL